MDFNPDLLIILVIIYRYFKKIYWFILLSGSRFMQDWTSVNWFMSWMRENNSVFLIWIIFEDHWAWFLQFIFISNLINISISSLPVNIQPTVKTFVVWKLLWNNVLGSFFFSTL